MDECYTCSQSKQGVTMQRKTMPDLSFVRQAATAMSSGLLLVLIGSPSRIAVIGLLFCIVSLFFLANGFLQLFRRTSRIVDIVRKYNDLVVVLFTLTSLISIYRNWTTLTERLQSQSSTDSLVSSIQASISVSIVYWLILFGIILCVVSIVDWITITRRSLVRIGRLNWAYRSIALFAYLAACYMIAVYGVLNFDLPRSIFALALASFTGWYLVIQKRELDRDYISSFTTSKNYDSVVSKFKRASYFLNNIKILAIQYRSLSYVPLEYHENLRANLDAFFFELISAKDMFLQEINNKWVGLPKDQGNSFTSLKKLLISKGPASVINVVISIETGLSDHTSWIWKINNYRNSATHRELLHFGFVASTSLPDVQIYLFENPNDPNLGNASIEVLPYCEKSLKEMDTYLSSLYTQLPN
jgi:hypothetical protein